jgi:dTDP-6-deoxy-L-talose 4-dehydrogenase (NAD+)
MKVLLTGHAGFIGQHLLKILIKKKISLYVTVYNRLKIPHNNKINIIDLKKKNNLKKIKNFDVIIHTAWRALENYNSKKHINSIYKENFFFLKKLINLGAKNLTVLGTCFEIGSCQGEVDEAIFMKPNTFYGKAKKKLYLELEKLKKKRSFNLTWIRIFYVYGNNQKSKSLFSQINLQEKNKKKFFDLTDGKQLRDYILVNILAKKIFLLSFLKKDIGIINVCSGKPISIRKLVLTWKKKYKWKIRFNFGKKSLKRYEPNDFWGSITKLRKILN